LVNLLQYRGEVKRRKKKDERTRWKRARQSANVENKKKVRSLDIWFFILISMTLFTGRGNYDRGREGGKARE
jgi:hypothetical protein